MTTRTVLWSRFTFCIFSVAVFILFTSQYQSYRYEYSCLSKRYKDLVAYSDGLAAQLQLTLERNRKAEGLLKSKLSEDSLALRECGRKVRSAELAKSLHLTSLKKCNAENERLNDTFRNVSLSLIALSSNPPLALDGNPDNLRKVIIKLEEERTNAVERAKQLEDLLKEATDKLTECAISRNKTNANLVVKAFVTTKEPYVQGEKVRFDRLHPVKEELEFKRNGKIFQSLKIIPDSVLVERLKSKNKSKQKSREQRLQENGAEEEQADANVQDYKDMVSTVMLLNRGNQLIAY